MALKDTIDALERLPGLAKELRAAGVLRLTCDGVDVWLAHPVQELPSDFGKKREAEKTTAAIDDPETFGREPPKYSERRRRPKQVEE